MYIHEYTQYAAFGCCTPQDYYVLRMYRQCTYCKWDRLSQTTQSQTSSYHSHPQNEHSSKPKLVTLRYWRALLLVHKTWCTELILNESCQLHTQCCPWVRCWDHLPRQTCEYTTHTVVQLLGMCIYFNFSFVRWTFTALYTDSHLRTYGFSLYCVCTMGWQPIMLDSGGRQVSSSNRWYVTNDSSECLKMISQFRVSAFFHLSD